MTGAVGREARSLRGLLPEGTPLPDEDWARRHAVISTIALLHVPVVLVWALIVFEPAHAIVETLPIAAAAVAGRSTRRGRLIAEILTTLSLVTSSAALVHLSGGYIELHFHFFVIVALVTLYQQWTPFLLAIGFVALHHGIAGAIDPTSVYNHPAALNNPWTWAGIHAAFIAMASAVGLANWKLNEAARHRAEDYFRRLYEGEAAVVQRLREADRVKSELLATVSHEFRTPLTTIIGAAQMLHRQPDVAPEQVSELAGNMARQGHRLQYLVENLLEAEKPLTRTDGTTAADTLIEEGVQTVLAGERSEDGGIDVDVTAGLRLPVAAEAAQLIIANLVSNAIKFRDPGTQVSVTAASDDDGRPVIQVRNQGPGVPPELRERIFQPFVQGDSSNTRRADGVGLGLHIVHRVVTIHGGTVTLTCDDGVTTFTVVLPASQDAPQERPAESQQPDHDELVLQTGA